MAASLICATLFGPIPAISAEPPEAAAARHLAATLGGSPGGYSLAYQRPLTSGGAGTLAFGGTWAGKFVNPRSGEVEAVYVTADGQVGGPELLAAQQAAGLAALPPLMRKADVALQGAVAAAATEPV
ncbi:MAG: hypothetical protein ACRDGJ_07520, partial [Candidatus Limnocylindria bacterium]